MHVGVYLTVCVSVCVSDQSMLCSFIDSLASVDLNNLWQRIDVVGQDSVSVCLLVVHVLYGQHTVK